MDNLSHGWEKTHIVKFCQILTSSTFVSLAQSTAGRPLSTETSGPILSSSNSHPGLQAIRARKGPCQAVTLERWGQSEGPPSREVPKG